MHKLILLFILFLSNLIIASVIIPHDKSELINPYIERVILISTNIRKVFNPRLGYKVLDIPEIVKGKIQVPEDEGSRVSVATLTARDPTANAIAKYQERKRNKQYISITSITMDDGDSGQYTDTKGVVTNFIVGNFKGIGIDTVDPFAVDLYAQYPEKVDYEKATAEASARGEHTKSYFSAGKQYNNVLKYQKLYDLESLQDVYDHQKYAISKIKKTFFKNIENIIIIIDGKKQYGLRGRVLTNLYNVETNTSYSELINQAGLNMNAFCIF